MDQVQHLTAGFQGFVDTVISETETLLGKGEIVVADIEKLVASMKTAKTLGLGTIAQFGVGSVKNADGSDWQVGQPLPLMPVVKAIEDAPQIRSSLEADVAPVETEFKTLEEAIAIDAQGNPIPLQPKTE